MITGSPLFAGTNNVEQWNLIVKVVGTPNETFSNSLPEGIKSFVENKDDYVTPEHWFIRFIKVVLLGALIGAIVGGIIKIATDASKIFGHFIDHLFDGPSKWFTGQKNRIKNV